MKWRLILKDKSTFPTTGIYTDWKERLSEEAKDQCVYCAIHEARFGGLRNFHVEHFRPQSKFRSLENSYGNLFFACAICNSFKGNDWPCEPCTSFSQPTYIDPSVFDYSKLIEVKGHLATSDLVSSRYMIERLYLNRPQLIIERRISACVALSNDLMEKVGKISEISETIQPESRSEEFQKLLDLLLGQIAKCSLNLAKLHSTKPYTKQDTTRPKK